MQNSIKALLYRNILLYQKILFLSILIIAWGFINLSFDSHIPPSTFVAIYIIFLTLQYQCVFAHGMVDDRQSKFRILYKIMGLNNKDYLISQFFSFFIISGITCIILFGSLMVMNKYHGEVLLDNYTQRILFMSFILIIQEILFSMIVSYLFKNPAVARDISFILHILLLYFVVYCIMKNKYMFLRFFFPYFGVSKFFKETGMGIMEETEGYSLLSEMPYTIFQTVFMIFLVFYLDNIYPSDDDNQKNFLFFLDYFKNKFKRRELGDINRVLERDIETRSQEKMVDLEVKNLHKYFGNYHVLKNINLSFNKGNMYSLLGHNGAGKSTFVNILTGIYRPTSGSLLWKNKDFRKMKRNAQKLFDFNIGICPSFECLFENLTVYNHLKVIGLIKEIKNLEKRIKTVMRLLNITQYENFSVSKLSGGNKRKLSLGISLMSKPTILFLDEPTSSIDPVSRKEIWDILLSLKKNKEMITILTTHHLEEAEILSDSISVLSFGEIIVQGTVEEIKKKFGVGYQIEIFPDSELENFKEDLVNISDLMKNKYGEKMVKYSKRKIVFKIELENKNNLENILKFIKKNLPEKFNMVLNSNTLEKAFLEIDKLQQKNSETLTKAKTQKIIDNLYTKKKLNSLSKINLIIKNKINFFFSDFLEVFKLLSLYICMILLFSLLMNFIRKKDRIKISYIEYFIMLFIIMEVSMYSFNAYNYVYDKSRNIKILLYTNKISILEYFLGKFITDIIFQVFTYLLVYVCCYYAILEELKVPEFAFMFNLLFFKVFVWRLSFVSFCYLLARLFSNLRSVLKYFSLVYGAWMGIVSLVVWLTKLKFLGNISDLKVILDIYNNPNFRYLQTLNIFFIQMLIFWVVLFILEHFELKANYIFGTEKSNFPQINQISTSTITDDYFLNKNKTVENEIKNTLEKSNQNLKAINLYKKYPNGKVALKSLTFGLDKGISFGLVGPNGAGKSTTFNIILNKVLKTDGKVKIKNSNYKTRSLKEFLKPSVFQQNNFGVSFQGNALWEKMNVKNNLVFYSQLNNINYKSLMELVKYFEFDYYMKKKVDELSSGNKRKLCIMISMLVNPDIILYDEATCGVDIMIRLKLKNIFDYMKKKNNAVGIFTTHFLKDVEVFCDKLGLIDDGRFICVDFVQNIKKNLGGYLVQLIQPEENKLRQIENILKEMGVLKKAKTIEVSDRSIHQYFIYENKSLIDLFSALIKMNNEKFYKEFNINQLSIEDIYLNLLKKEE